MHDSQEADVAEEQNDQSVAVKAVQKRGKAAAGQPGSSFLSAAVKGFVVSSDRDLLLSKKKTVEKAHHCHICGEDFALARVCETHKILEHKVPAPWKCSECGMQFLQGTSYYHHMVQSHNAKPYACDIDGCSAVFQCKMRLAVHKHEHHKTYSPGKGKMVFQCQFCQEEFPQQCRLKYHMRKHTGEEPYKCPHCGRTFRSSSHRNMHVKAAHSVDKVRSHLCDWCGKKFFNAAQLRAHVLSHTGERPYQCSVCSRSFTKSNARRVHMRQHTGEKPYVCDQCGQSFTVRVSLRTHLKSKHGVVVDTSMYRRQGENEDSTVPTIGRPKKNDRLKVNRILDGIKDELEGDRPQSQQTAVE
ncbi:hypothetical protein ACOMHN_046793 [Nucella lapillus]